VTSPSEKGGGSEIHDIDERIFCVGSDPKSELLGFRVPDGSRARDLMIVWRAEELRIVRSHFSEMGMSEVGEMRSGDANKKKIRIRDRKTHRGRRESRGGDRARRSDSALALRLDSASLL
jgi:hypothetical protein